MSARDSLLPALFSLSLVAAAALPASTVVGCAKQTTSTGGALSNDIEMTGVPAFDDVFTQVRDVDERLDSARVALRDGRTTLNSALGLTKGTPFADAYAELLDRAQGKLQLVVEGTTPQLAVSDAVPSNVQTAVDAANSSLQSYQTALTDVTSVKDEIGDLVTACEAFPTQLASDAGSLGITLSQIPDIASTLDHNLGLMKNFPNRVDKLSGELVANLDTVRKGGTGSTSSSTTSTSSQEEDLPTGALP